MGKYSINFSITLEEVKFQSVGYPIDDERVQTFLSQYGQHISQFYIREQLSAPIGEQTFLIHEYCQVGNTVRYYLNNLQNYRSEIYENTSCKEIALKEIESLTIKS